MFKVGLTGGIGSGKSTLANIFADLGVKLINLDEVAREVVTPGQPALEKIATHFGSDLIQDNGQLDRGLLRERIFESNEERVWLESLLHPLIRQRQQELVDTATSPYVIIEIPLLAENGLQDTVDRVLVVDTPEATQLSRTTARDGASEENIKKIMATQASRDARLNIADDVLLNDGTIDDLRKGALALHHKYLELATQASN